MFYKKIGLIISLFSFFLLIKSSSSCSHHKDPVSVPYSNNRQDYHNQKLNQPQLFFYACKQLPSLSYLKGRKVDFLINIEGQVTTIDPQLPSQLALIGIPNGTSITKESPIVVKAIDKKNEVEKLIWQQDGSFIFWLKAGVLHPETKKFKFSTPITIEDKSQYIKLTSKGYKLHMLGVQNGAHAISAAWLPIDSIEKYQSLPDYESISLKALSATQNNSDWFLKGAITNSYTNNDKSEVGFLLVKEGVNPHNLIQQAIADGNEWPTKPELFNNGDLIIVPGTFRSIEPNIAAHLSRNDFPMRSGRYKVCCYFIQNRRHYYLSQMEYFLPNVAQSSVARDSAPPLITFDGGTHTLNISNLKLSRDKIAGQLKNTKLSGGIIQYSIDGQKRSVPSNQTPYVVFVKATQGVTYIWRTSIIESLVKDLATSNSNDRTKGNILVVKDPTKPLTQSATDFLISEKAYSYFPCLCSKEGNIFKFHGLEEKLIIEEGQNKPITLDNTEAHITFRIGGFWKKLLMNHPHYTTYVFPKVRLNDTINNVNQGYIIVEIEKKESIKEKIAKLFDRLDGNKSYVYEPALGFLFLEKVVNTEAYEQINTSGPSEFSIDLYKAWHKSLDKQNLLISYWIASPKGEIICSDPVSLIIQVKSKN